MKMFPHGFSTASPVTDVVASGKASRAGDVTKKIAKKGFTKTTKPIKIDVEIAVDIMLAAGEMSNDGSRNRCRLQVIKTLPSQSIDWDSIDWVQIWPFQTVRLQ